MEPLHRLQAEQIVTSTLEVLSGAVPPTMVIILLALVIQMVKLALAYLLILATENRLPVLTLKAI